MKKGRMLKFEQFYQDYLDRDFEAVNKKDQENRRSYGPTLTDEQIMRPVRAAWSRLVREVRRKAKEGNPHARKMRDALDDNDEPRGTAWLDAVDEYFHAVRWR